MNIQQIDQSSVRADFASTSGSERPRRRGYSWLLALVLGALCFGASGCVSDGYVGVSAYPNYASQYGYYGYGGAPYYGYGGVYSRRVVVGGRRYSGGYGRHHFARDRRRATRLRRARSEAREDRRDDRRERREDRRDRRRDRRDRR